MPIAAIPFWENETKYYAVHYTSLQDIYNLQTKDEVDCMIMWDKELRKSSIDKNLVEVSEVYMEILRDLYEIKAH